MVSGVPSRPLFGRPLPVMDIQKDLPERAEIDDVETWAQLNERWSFLPTSRPGRLELIKRRGFPAPRYINGNLPVFKPSEVKAWIDARPRKHHEAVKDGMGTDHD